ncbi:SagB/ThcOx family dehydrogenase [Amycolatopsis sp. NPDC059021]|uniref:SagB/ThcOx family dehydrogenase n=1 Tax=Amycolatopsis sp. NPDC059021 TaxID=3346704 RepID=UPI00366F9A11
MTPQGRGGPGETIQLWSLTEDALVELGEDGSVVVVTRWGEFEFPETDELIRESLRRMALGPISLTNVAAAVHYSEPATEYWAVALRKVLDRLGGSVVHTLGLTDGGAPLLSAIPVTLAPSFAVRPVPGEQPLKLSRFVSMRPAEDGLLVVSPCARYQVLLVRHPAIVIASSLATPTSIAQVVAVTGLSWAVVADVVAFLVAAGVVLAGDERGRFAEDDDPELSFWAPDDLLFHIRSRTWQSAGPPDFGAARDGTPPPVVKPVTAGPTFPLYRPEISADAPGRTLTALLEDDHVCPAFTERELDARQVGEFLYRAARVRSVGPAHLPSGPSHEASQRPYFSVACLYELELYVSVNRCSGLAKGVYHYDPLWHTLTLINDDAADLGAMLDMAMVAGGSNRRPSLLLTIATRMSRIAWVLGGAAYTTTLVHVGALQQVLYLTAKGMGLAAHAVPVDASDRVDRALKLEWPAEVSVGECVLDFPW